MCGGDSIVTWTHLPSADHPIWPIARLLALTLLLFVSSTHFDITELLTIAGMGGVEGLKRVVSK